MPDQVFNAADRTDTKLRRETAEGFEWSHPDQRMIKSESNREKWKHTLEHLISGSTGASERDVPGFGDMFIDQITATHVQHWKVGIEGLIDVGDYKPVTANGWLSILKVVMKAARREFSLATLATEFVAPFDESDHPTYTEEEPNSLRPEEVPAFLACVRDLYPQHYAMAYLGFATGLRPSSLRPLRRQGPTPDVLWSENRLLVRRSQTIGPNVMNTTKQGTRYSIHMPQQMMDVLKWHVETLQTPEQRESDLLFPSSTGGFRCNNAMNDAFADTMKLLKIPRRLTQRGMRRTFNDLARAAGIEGIVTRSVSGHLTEQMQHHYESVTAAEQRVSIGKVIDLMEARANRSGAPSGASGSASGASSKKAG